MRLTEQQVSTIIGTAQAVAGANSSVWLYGSRLDDLRRGGDIDLMVESIPPVSLRHRARIKIELEAKLNRRVGPDGGYNRQPVHPDSHGRRCPPCGG